MSSAVRVGPVEGIGKVALCGVDSATAAVLTDCFRQFGIQAEGVGPQETFAALDSYQACVVALDADGAAVLQKIREHNHRIVVYGTCGSIREALRYAHLGINAVFHTPVSKQEGLRVVRSTHLLVMHELRRYVRVPLVCGVTIETGTEVVQASTTEISAGGMSLITNSHLVVPQIVLLTIELPGTGPVAVRSIVCWTRDTESMAGIRFDPEDQRRFVVRRWIDDYLDS